MKIVVAAARVWTAAKTREFCERRGDIEVSIVHQPSELTYDRLRAISPDYVFFPHWSWRIPPEIYGNFRCIVFHPSDLPFGRGGSPIQNLIEAGFQSTKISAIEVTGEMDAGGVFLKRDLLLLGTAEEIYLRMQDVIFDEMIPFILENEPVPVPQNGDGTIFKRRTPAMGAIRPEMTIKQVFNTIRMLDAEGYPHAFLDFGPFRFTFTRASLKANEILADVVITKQGDDGSSENAQ